MSSPQSATRKEIQYKKLTDAKLQARRDKRLCHSCEEKWFVGHRCKAKELRLLLANDNLEQDGERVEVECEEENDREGNITELAELSLNTVVGFTDMGTMKV